VVVAGLVVASFYLFKACEVISLGFDFCLVLVSLPAVAISL
jgi:hypothetical protein